MDLLNSRQPSTHMGLEKMGLKKGDITGSCIHGSTGDSSVFASIAYEKDGVDFLKEYEFSKNPKDIHSIILKKTKLFYDFALQDHCVDLKYGVSGEKELRVSLEDVRLRKLKIKLLDLKIIKSRPLSEVSSNIAR